MRSAHGEKHNDDWVESRMRTQLILYGWLAGWLDDCCVHARARTSIHNTIYQITCILSAPTATQSHTPGITAAVFCRKITINVTRIKKKNQLTINLNITLTHNRRYHSMIFFLLFFLLLILFCILFSFQYAPGIIENRRGVRVAIGRWVEGTASSTMLLLPNLLL